jgi:hypothetical protein
MVLMCMIKGSFSNYLTWISQLRKAYKNYVKVALNLFRGKKQIGIITRFNEKFVLPSLYVKNYAIAVSSSFFFNQVQIHCLTLKIITWNLHIRINV